MQLPDFPRSFSWIVVGVNDDLKTCGVCGLRWVVCGAHNGRSFTVEVAVTKGDAILVEIDGVIANSIFATEAVGVVHDELKALGQRVAANAS